MSKKQEPLTVEQMDVQISQAGETAKRVLKALFDKPTGRSLQLNTTTIARALNEDLPRNRHKTVHQVRNALDRLLRRGIVMKSNDKSGTASRWQLNLAVPTEAMSDVLERASEPTIVTNDIVLSNDLPPAELDNEVYKSTGQDSIA